MSLRERCKRCLKQFCDVTGLHGYSYMVSPRNPVEVVFWLLVCIGALLYGGYICREGYRYWMEHPIHTYARTYNYPLSKVPFPALTLCAKQNLDEFQMVSTMLNQLKFRCKGPYYKGDEDLESCSLDEFKQIREAPFLASLLELFPQFVDFMLEQIDGDLDLMSTFIWNFPKFNDVILDIATDAIAEASGDTLPYPRMEKVPKDEYKYTLNLLPIVLKHYAEFAPVQTYYNKTADGQLIFSNLIFSMLGVFRLMKKFDDTIHLLPTLDKIRPLDSNLGQLNGDTKTKISMPNAMTIDYCYPSNPICEPSTKIQTHTKSLYFTNNWGQLNIGSMIRNFLHPLMNEESWVHYPFDWMNSFTDKLIKGMINATRFDSGLSPICDTIFMDDNRADNNKALECDPRDREPIPLESSSVQKILSIITHSKVVANVPRKTDYIRLLLSETETLGSFAQISPNISANQEFLAKDNTPHYLNKISVDFTVNPYKLFVLFDQSITEFIRDQILAQGKLKEVKEHHTGQYVSQLEMAKLCYGFDCEQDLDHVLTAQGLCAVFNGEHVQSIRKEAQLDHILRKFLVHKSQVDTSRVTLAALQEVQLVLDLHNSDQPRSQDGSLIVGISDPSSYLNSVVSTIQAGTRINIKLTIQAQTASESIHAVDRESRNCRFKKENSASSFFKAYAQDHCLFECKLNFVLSSNLSCVPWDIPVPDRGDERAYSICRGQQSYEFKQSMDQVDQTLHCAHCVEDCEKFIYRSNEDLVLIDSGAECKKQDVFDSLIGEEESIAFKIQHSLRLNYFQGDSVYKKMCRHKMRHDVVILKVEALVDSVMEIHSDIASTFSAQIGLIGGTLGLLTGGSLFLILEFVQLVLRIAVPKKVLNFLTVSSPSRPKPLAQIFFKYCETSTIHGLIFIALGRASLGKWMWGLFVLSAFGISIVFAQITYRNFKAAIVTVLEDDTRNLEDIPYPALTICPQQFNDRWSLQRILLNHVSMRDEGSGMIPSQVYDAFEGFFHGFLTHPWISETALDALDLQDLSQFWQWLGVNNHIQGFGEQFANEILSGKLLDASQIESLLLVEGAPYLEVDLLIRTKFWSIAVDIHDMIDEDEIVLSASNKSITKDSSPSDVEKCMSLSVFYVNASIRIIQCKHSLNGRFIQLNVNGTVKSGPGYTTVCYNATDVYFHGRCLHPVFHSDASLSGACPDRYAHILYPENLRNTSEMLSEKGKWDITIEQLNDNRTTICYGEDFIGLLYIRDAENWPVAYKDHFQHISSYQNLVQYRLLNRTAPRTNLGSLLASFSETAIGGSFYHNKIHEENRLIIDPRSLELHLYDYSQKLLNNLIQWFGEESSRKHELSIPLIELPVLLDPITKFLGDIHLSDYEQASRRVYYVHYKKFEKSLLGNTKGVISGYVPEDFVDIASNLDASGIQNGIQLATYLIKELNKVETGYKYNLLDNPGAEDIKKAYAENTYGRILSQYWQEVMLVMRFSKVMVQVAPEQEFQEAIFNRSEGITDLPRKTKRLSFPQEFKYWKVSQDKWILAEEVAPDSLNTDQTDAATWNRLEAVQSCRSEIFDEDTCLAHFYHVFTDRGICSALNTMGVRHQLKKSDYLAQFESIFQPSGLMKPTISPQFGLEGKLSMLLDAHSMEIQGTEHGAFILSFNEFHDSLDTLEGVSILPGQMTTCSIHAEEVSTSDDIRDNFAPKERGCRFLHENLPSTEMFKYYSYSNCRYECKLHHAVEALGCMPWDYIRPDSYSEVPLCTRDLVTRFQEIMLNRGNSSRKCSSCLPNCQNILYHLTIDTRMVDEHSECQSMRLQIQAYKGCLEKVSKDFVYLDVVFIDSKVPMSTKMRQYDFFDQLGIVGGTLGLHCGFSIISGIEFLYWMFLAAKFKLLGHKA